MWFSLLSAVLVIFVACSIRWRLKVLKIFRENNIPGPPPRFLWGNYWEIYWNGSLVMQRRWHEQYGPIVGYFHGLWPIILVADIELLKKVFFKDFHKFCDRSDVLNGAIVGELEHSLIVLKGKRWREVRATLTPSFTSKKLKEIMPVVCACADRFMQKLDEDFDDSTPCDLHEFYQALTLDTICQAAMGVDYGTQKDLKKWVPLRRARVLFSIPISFVYLISVSFPILLHQFGRAGCRIYFWLFNHLEDPAKAFRDVTKEAVRFRRLNPEKSRRSDLLQLMMDAQDRGGTAEVGAEKKTETERAKTTANSNNDLLPGYKAAALTDRELFDNAFLVLAAGFETTSSSLAFLTKMLVRFPEVQERVRAELLAVTHGGKVFDFERLQSCQYTEAVLQETLRMYPPAIDFTARAAAEDVNYGKIRIPRGVIVTASTNELEHKDDVFPEPFDFRPERFLPENRTPAMAASHVPFGAGPRICLGMRFAQMEIKVTLAKLLTKYRISSKNEPLHEPMIRTTLLPFLQRIKDPLKCDLELL